MAVRGFVIPESEVLIQFSRSSGPGGQNVNKVSTKVQITWEVLESSAFSDFEKGKILDSARSSGHATPSGKVLITEQQTRSQEANKLAALDRLIELVTKALTPQKRRVKTKTPRRAVEKRLKGKKTTSDKKAGRRKGGWE